MLKILGYLGIAGFGFLIYLLLIAFEFPLHWLRDFINLLILLIYIWYGYFFVRSIVAYKSLSGSFKKFSALILYFVSLLFVFLLSAVIIGSNFSKGDALTPSHYTFEKSCIGYDIVSKNEWMRSIVYYVYLDWKYSEILSSFADNSPTCLNVDEMRCKLTTVSWKIEGCPEFQSDFGVNTSIRDSSLKDDFRNFYER